MQLLLEHPCVQLLISDKPVKGKGLIIWPYLYDAKKLSYYFAGGNTAGAIVKWFRNTLCQWEIENQKNGGPSAIRCP